MKQWSFRLSGVCLFLLVGCAQDGPQLAPIEGREVRALRATVSGRATPAAPVVPTPTAALPPDAPKVTALAEPETTMARPTELPTPVPAPSATTAPQGMTAPPPVPPGSVLSPQANVAPSESSASVAEQSTGALAAESTANRPAAVRGLLKEAETARQAADFTRARSALERGVKLAPRDPELWYRLAEVAFAERDWEQARTLAERASSLARLEPALKDKATGLAAAAAAKQGAAGTR